MWFDRLFDRQSWDFLSRHDARSSPDWGEIAAAACFVACGWWIDHVVGGLISSCCFLVFGIAGK